MSRAIPLNQRLPPVVLHALGWLLLVICFAICVWAQYVTFDGEVTCGGRRLWSGQNCVDLSGNRPDISYDEMYAIQSASVGITTMYKGGIAGALGAIVLFLACYRTVAKNQLSPRDALLNALVFGTAPLLLLAVSVQVLAANLGAAWVSPIGVTGLSQGVLTAIVALAGAAIVPAARRADIRSAEMHAEIRVRRNIRGLPEQERRDAIRRMETRKVEHEIATEREARIKELRDAPLQLTNPASDLWQARRAGTSDVAPHVWQVLLQRTAGVAGLALLAGAVMVTGWAAFALTASGLILVSTRASSRPPTSRTALLWGTSAALAYAVSVTQLVPVQPLSWSALITSTIALCAAYYQTRLVGFACATARTSHVWWHLPQALTMPLAVLLAVSAPISLLVPAVVAYVVAFGTLGASFPLKDQFPSSWRAFRLGILGTLLAAGGLIALLGSTPTTLIGGGVYALAAVVGAVQRSPIPSLSPEASVTEQVSRSDEVIDRPARGQ